MLVAILEGSPARTGSKERCYDRCCPHPSGTARRFANMIDLYDKATDQLIGSITEADLQVLVSRRAEFGCLTRGPEPLMLMQTPRTSARLRPSHARSLLLISP